MLFGDLEILLLEKVQDVKPDFAYIFLDCVYCLIVVDFCGKMDV